MTVLNIDRDKCKKDGICGLVCPGSLIRLPDDDGYPEMIDEGDERCIACGHCVAACPNAALEHRLVPIGDCTPIRKELIINEEQAVQFLRSRRSIRVYRDKPVEKEKIQRLIEIARYGPTGSNTQMVKWVVLNDREKVHELSLMVIEWIGDILENSPESSPFPIDRLPLYLEAWDNRNDRILRNAPALVIAAAPEESGMVNLTILLTYLELAAPAIGLGACWAGLLKMAMASLPALREMAGLSDENPNYYPMMLGYTKYPYHRLPERKPPDIHWK